MSLISKLASPKFLGSSGVVCAECVAIQFVEEGEYEQILEEDKNDVLLPKPVFLQENLCFESMFSGVDLGREINEKEISEVDVPKNILSVDEQVNGCASIKLSHDLRASPIPFWTLNMGIVMKGEKAGWALYIDGIGGISQPQTSDSDQEEVIQPPEEELKYGQFLNYSLLLLTKNEENAWSVNAGYSWKDNEISGHELKLYISDADGNIIIDAKGHISSRNGFSFNGLWISDLDFNSQPMLGQMEIKGQKFNSPLVIGRKYSFKEPVDGWRLFLHEIYNPNTKTWSRNINDKVDLGRILDDWYTPFMNKKGKWIEPESHQGIEGNHIYDDEEE